MHSILSTVEFTLQLDQKSSLHVLQKTKELTLNIDQFDYDCTRTIVCFIRLDFDPHGTHLNPFKCHELVIQFSTNLMRLNTHIIDDVYHTGSLQEMLVGGPTSCMYAR